MILNASLRGLWGCWGRWKKEKACSEVRLKDQFTGTIVEAKAEGISGRRHSPHLQNAVNIKKYKNTAQKYALYQFYQSVGCGVGR